MSACVICDKPDDQRRPTIYRGSPWCCGRHRDQAEDKKGRYKAT